MKKITKIIFVFLFTLSTFFVSGCKNSPVSYRINLEIWGLFDSSDTFTQIFSEYKKINPFIGEIKYKKLSQETYKKDLLDAMASGQGPDIFLVQNNWLPAFKDKVEAAPNWIITEQDYRNNFVDVASQNFIEESQIYAMPLTVDSLALYYNKDLFNAEGITAPPKTWQEFKDDVVKLTKIDQFGNIVQSGAAFGTAYNINRSTDLISLLMMQRGAEMVSSDGREVRFDKVISDGSSTVSPGEESLNFYTQFANISKPAYSWNRKMHYSIDAFTEQNTAMMINYSWQYETIKNKNSKLNFAVAPIPQLNSKAVNYANYWAYAVAKNKTAPTDDDFKKQNPANFNYSKVRVHEAWELLKFMGMNNGGKFTLINGVSGTTKTAAIPIDPAEKYAESTKRPAARKDLIEKQKTDVALGPFAYGNLIAKSWYQVDPESTESILAEMIDSVNVGNSASYDALKLAANRINQFMRK